MPSGRRKKKQSQNRKEQSIVEILKNNVEFTEVKTQKKNELVEITSFQLKGIHLALEIHKKGVMILFRLINSFNPKQMNIIKDTGNLLNIANKFNRRSIGIKCSVFEKDGLNFITFTTEEITTKEGMMNLTDQSIYIQSAILSGAPVLFEKIGQEEK